MAVIVLIRAIDEFDGSKWIAIIYELDRTRVSPFLLYKHH
jgi:hypothetical protein